MIFSKLNGLGNDFVITDDRENKYTENLDEMARKLCHRRTGIGADGLVFVRKSETCDVRMQIFNSDGSEAEMCGNGVRCFAKYVYDKGIFKHERMSVETLAGPMIIDLTVKDGVAVAAKVDMGVPETRREFIPVVGTGECQLEKLAAVDTARRAAHGCVHGSSAHGGGSIQVRFRNRAHDLPLPQKDQRKLYPCAGRSYHRGAHLRARLRPHACLRHGFLQRGGVLRNGGLHRQKGGGSAGAWLAAH